MNKITQSNEKQRTRWLLSTLDMRFRSKVPLRRSCCESCASAHTSPRLTTQSSRLGLHTAPESLLVCEPPANIDSRGRRDMMQAQESRVKRAFKFKFKRAFQIGLTCFGIRRLPINSQNFRVLSHHGVFPAEPKLPPPSGHGRLHGRLSGVMHSWSGRGRCSLAHAGDVHQIDSPSRSIFKFVCISHMAESARKGVDSSCAGESVKMMLEH